MAKYFMITLIVSFCQLNQAYSLDCVNSSKEYYCLSGSTISKSVISVNCSSVNKQQECSSAWIFTENVAMLNGINVDQSKTPDLTSCLKFCENLTNCTAIDFNFVSMCYVSYNQVTKRQNNVSRFYEKFSISSYAASCRKDCLQETSTYSRNSNIEVTSDVTSPNRQQGTPSNSPIGLIVGVTVGIFFVIVFLVIVCVVAKIKQRNSDERLPESKQNVSNSTIQIEESSNGQSNIITETYERMIAVNLRDHVLYSGLVPDSKSPT